MVDNRKHQPQCIVFVWKIRIRPVGLLPIPMQNADILWFAYSRMRHPLLQRYSASVSRFEVHHVDLAHLLLHVLILLHCLCFQKLPSPILPIPGLLYVYFRVIKVRASCHGCLYIPVYNRRLLCRRPSRRKLVIQNVLIEILCSCRLIGWYNSVFLVSLV